MQEHEQRSHRIPLATGKDPLALRAHMTKEALVREVTESLAAPLAGFPLNVMLNKDGHDRINSVMRSGRHFLFPA